MIEDGDLTIGDNDIIEIPVLKFKEILIEVRNEWGHGFTKSFRDCTESFYIDTITKFMEEYSFIKVKEDSILIMPLTGKVIGKYPEDYKGGVD